MFRFLVLGTGVGEAIVHYLVHQSNVGHVALADVTRERATKVLQRVRKQCSRKEVSTEALQCLADSVDHHFFKGFHVVISAVPARYNLHLACEAIKARVHFVDLGGVLDVTFSLLGLNREAKEARICIAPDNGIMPGAGNIFARMLEGEDVVVWNGGLPQYPVPPVYYSPPYNPEGLLHICKDRVPVLENGQMRWIVDPLSEVHITSEVFLELAGFENKFMGCVEAFPSSGVSLAPWSLQACGVKNFREMTIRWPGFSKYLRKIPEDTFVETVKRVMKPITSRNPDFMFLKIESSRQMERDRIRKVECFNLLERFDHKTGLSAMKRTTGFAAAIVAQMIAEGRTSSGVYTPECLFDVRGCDEFVARFRTWCPSLRHSSKYC